MIKSWFWSGKIARDYLRRVIKIQNFCEISNSVSIKIICLEREKEKRFNVLEIRLKIVRRIENRNFMRKSQTSNEKRHDEGKCLNFLSWILVHTKNELSFVRRSNHRSHLKGDS